MINTIGKQIKLLIAFQKTGGQKFSDIDWLQHIMEATETRFQHNIIPEMSNSTFAACKDTLVGSSFRVDGSRRYSIQMERIPVPGMLLCTSVLKSGLIAGGARKQRRKTGPSSRLSTHFGENPDEEPRDDFSKPRKVQHRKWKSRQDVHWIN